MKAQFKYAFLEGFHVRFVAFSITFGLSVAAIILSSLDLLPLAAKVAAVSICGVGIGVTAVFNIISDIKIAGRMFSAPGAYMTALSPTPRRSVLLASALAMAVLDFVTMAAVILGETFLSFKMAGNGISGFVLNAAASATSQNLIYNILYLLTPLAGYMLYMMIIFFCVSARKSIFFGKPGGKLLTALLAAITIYAVNLSAFLLVPFANVVQYGIFFTISVSLGGLAVYVLLTFISAGALLLLTSYLMERKLNI